MGERTGEIPSKPEPSSPQTPQRDRAALYMALGLATLGTLSILVSPSLENPHYSNSSAALGIVLILIAAGGTCGGLRSNRS